MRVFRRRLSWGDLPMGRALCASDVSVIIPILRHSRDVISFPIPFLPIDVTFREFPHFPFLTLPA